ncbi:hypothetical protein KAR48_10375 [bacterium]|nr:hypothetical protein [bacterium]
MMSMRFDFRDIFQAPRIAFSLQRLWLQSIGLLGGYSFYLLCTYAAFALGGHDLAHRWSYSGLFPCVIGQALPWYSWIIAVIGFFGTGFVLMATGAAVSRAAYMHLKGNVFYTWKEALCFAFSKKAGSLIGAPLAVGLIIGMTVFGGLFIGFISKLILPVGAVTISLLTVIIFAAGLFLIFTILAFCLSIILAPAIVATTDDDAFEGIFQSFSIIHAQPWRFLLYESLTAVLAILGLATLAFFAKLAWGASNTVIVLGMGQDYGNISYQATAYVQQWLYPVVSYIRAIAGSAADPFFFSQDFMLRHLPAMQQSAAIITAIFMLIIGGVIISFPMAVWNTGQTILFILIKNLKESDNLLDRIDDEEEVDEKDVSEITRQPDTA